MKLYHVSRNNKNLDIIDMSKSIKNDIVYVYFLMDNMMEYGDFYHAYHSELMQKYSTEKEWGPNKIATEAIFEYIRLTEYSKSPSRLLYTYFTDSIEKATVFNETERENDGGYFSFDADEDKVYYYDMDIFDSAVEILRAQGLTKMSFEKVKKVARIYWQTSKKGHTEIIYKGNPVLKNISELVKNDGV